MYMYVFIYSSFSPSVFSVSCSRLSVFVPGRVAGPGRAALPHLRSRVVRSYAVVDELGTTTTLVVVFAESGRIGRLLRMRGIVPIPSGRIRR